MKKVIESKTILRRYSFLLFTLSWLVCSAFAAEPMHAIAIHGGAGTILKKNMTPEKEKAYQDALLEALTIGNKILAEGGTSLDAVVATIVYLEDSPLFNAGKGAVFTHDGTNELDASIMNGADLSAGAVAGVTTVKNPIQLARAVMEQSPHVMMSGKGAEQFAKQQGIDLVDPKYFYTERRWKALQKRKKKDKKAKLDPDAKHGTVGVVALDRHGNLAAGTSTGGMTNKRYGRIGDSPIIGAGTYADNASCAVSATGHGEYFIRAAVAHDIAARVAYRGLSVKQASDEVVMKKLVEMGGTGGVIVLDRQGNVAMPFNTPGMYRGYQKAGEKAVIAIYKD